MSREHARSIWEAAVEAVRPGPLLRNAVRDLPDAERIVVMGAGKGGASMSVALDESLADRPLSGWVNVPEGFDVHGCRIHLHPARPQASNHPTSAGVAGSLEILRLAKSAGPNDLGICLWSGGGSALLPAPAEGVSLADKQAVTKQLHSCGATINEMNAVRKHLSAIKGGRLAEEFAGKALISLILSDVIGDPLDVIASGPTAPDPTTFADVWAILDRYDLLATVPAAVRDHLDRGRRGDIPDTPKSLPERIVNRVIGNNSLALSAARTVAEGLGYRVVDLGSAIDGETRDVAEAMSRTVRESSPGTCILSGGETTVTLPADHGKGGRNQEFVLAMLNVLGHDGLADVVVLSGGTDGEDGPTDAAGALADAGTFARAASLGLDPATALRRHDAYPFFDATGDLLRSGPTGTNVMDVRVILVDRPT